MNPIGVLDPIPWYKTRIFWGIVIGVLLLLSFYDFFSTFSWGDNMIGMGKNLVYSFGGALWWALGYNLFGGIGSIVVVLIYITIMGYLLYKIFQAKHVYTVYGSLFTVIFIISISFNMFLSGF